MYKLTDKFEVDKTKAFSDRFISLKNDVVQLPMVDTELQKFKNNEREGLNDKNIEAPGDVVNVSLVGEYTIKEILEMLYPGHYVLTGVSETKVYASLEGEYKKDELDKIISFFCNANGLNCKYENGIAYISKGVSTSIIGLSVYSHRFKFSMPDVTTYAKLILAPSYYVVSGNLFLCAAKIEEIDLLKHYFDIIDVDNFKNYFISVLQTNNADKFINQMRTSLGSCGVSSVNINFFALNNSYVMCIASTRDLLDHVIYLAQFVAKNIDFAGMSFFLKYRNPTDVKNYLIQYNKDLVVIADDLSNTVFIKSNYGSETANYNDIKRVVSMIDTKPKQLFIKVFLISVKSSDSLQVGMDSAFSNGGFDLKNIFGAPAVGGTTFTGTFKNFQTTFDMLQKKADAEILTKPALYIQSGQGGRVSFGSSVPYVTSKTIGIPNGLVQSVAYKDVGVIVDIKPVVTLDEILLDVQVENSALIDAAGVEGNPIFTSDTLKTKFYVKNNEVVYLAGLNQTSKNLVINGIPFLSGLKYVGSLFGINKRGRDKREIIICLSPHLMDSESMSFVSSKILDNFN